MSTVGSLKNLLDAYRTVQQYLEKFSELLRSASVEELKQLARVAFDDLNIEERPYTIDEIVSTLGEVKARFFLCGVVLNGLFSKTKFDIASLLMFMSNVLVDIGFHIIDSVRSGELPLLSIDVGNELIRIGAKIRGLLVPELAFLVKNKNCDVRQEKSNDTYYI